MRSMGKPAAGSGTWLTAAAPTLGRSGPPAAQAADTGKQPAPADSSVRNPLFGRRGEAGVHLNATQQVERVVQLLVELRVLRHVRGQSALGLLLLGCLALRGSGWRAGFGRRRFRSHKLLRNRVLLLAFSQQMPAKF